VVLKAHWRAGFEHLLEWALMDLGALPDTTGSSQRNHVAAWKNEISGRAWAFSWVS
jgi:hypothetical protein